VVTGINKLSFSVGVENNSLIEDINAAIMFTIKSAGDKEIIMINEVIKKANDPSNDLLKKDVLPYFIPIIAAAESDRLMTNRAIIATFSSNNNIVAVAPIRTQDAPENL